MNKITKTQRNNVAKNFLAAVDTYVVTKGFTAAGRGGDANRVTKQILKHVQELLAKLSTDAKVRESIVTTTKTLEKKTNQDVQEFTAYILSIGKTR